MADTMTERNSAAAQFLQEHDDLKSQLADATAKLAEQERELVAAYNKIDLQGQMLKNTTQQARLFQQYAFELSSQLQFVVSGAARALKIGATIRATIASGAEIPDVSGADVAEIEALLTRLAPNFGTMPAARKPDSLGDDDNSPEVINAPPPSAFFDGGLRFSSAGVHLPDTAADDNNTPEAQSLLASVGQAIGIGTAADEPQGDEPRISDDGPLTIEQPFLAPRLTANLYGLCPACGAPGVTRERRPNGNDVCMNGHTYSSRNAV